MRTITRTVLCCSLLLSTTTLGIGPRDPVAGAWHAWLESPGGPIPFGLELSPNGNVWQAWIVNGTERIAIPRVTLFNGRLTLDIDYYDSKIEARLQESGKRMKGVWSRRAPGEKWTRMPFHATAGERPRFDGMTVASSGASKKPTPLAERWTVRFSKSDEPAVGIFHAKADGRADGTFLTTTGDYRYLAGRFDGKRLSLSCFDGAHAFLFDARMQEDGSLAGDFWSRDTWHETWSALPDASATLPDTMHMTKWTGNAKLGSLSFPDLDGRMRSLNDKEFIGAARLIVVFGSWCPNCHDETNYLVELDRKYRERGLRIVGLAFEFSGDLARDTRQVRTYAKRHGINYPVLIAGVSDKGEASKAMPVLDRVRAYPTTIFADRTGSVRAIHTGFSGPATGDAHAKLRVEFERLIEEMLSAGPPRP